MTEKPSFVNLINDQGCILAVPLGPDFTDSVIAAPLQQILEERKDIELLQARLAVPNAPLAQVRTLLIRPDGHVAWASDEQGHEQHLHQLSAALSAWCNVQL